MSHNWKKVDSYSDGRRDRPDSYSSGRRDSYIPATDRDRAPPPRYDSRDSRDGGNHRALPGKLQRLDTNVKAPEGPRSAKVWTNSPASAREHEDLGSELKFKPLKSIKPNNANSAPVNPPLVIPKAKNREIQDAFECAYRWGEKCNKRLLLNIRKHKITQEKEQRQTEIKKILAKAPNYPPFQGLDAKINADENELDAQLRAADEEYIYELEQLVSRFVSGHKPAVTDPSQDTATDLALRENSPQPPTALDAKIEQVSELALKQAHEIETIKQRLNFTESQYKALNKQYDKLQTDYSLLQSNFKTIQSQQADNYAETKSISKQSQGIKSSHFALLSKFDAINQDFKTIQSQCADTGAENKSIRKHFQDFQSSTDKKLNISEQRLADLVKTSSSTAASSAQLTHAEANIASLEARLDTQDNARAASEARVTDTEVEVGKLKDKVYKLDKLKQDVDSLNELKEKLDGLEEKVDGLDAKTLDELCEAWDSENYSLKTLYLEYGRRQGTPLTDKAPHALSGAGTETTLSRKAIEAIVEAKVAAAEASINETTNSFCEQRDEIIGQMLENAVGRIDALEQGGESPYSRVDARVRLLEEWRATSRIDPREIEHLAQRLKTVESRATVQAFDELALNMHALNRKYDMLNVNIGRLAKTEWVETKLQEIHNGEGINVSGLHDELRDLQRRLPKLEHSINVLDSQFQHLSTKQLAEHIVRLTNPSLEGRFGKLETKTTEIEKLIQRQAAEKRMATPNLPDEPNNKKRKLEANGRQTSSLQPLQPAQGSGSLQES